MTDCMCTCDYCAQGQHDNCRKAKYDWCGDSPDPTPRQLPVVTNAVLAIAIVAILML